MMILRDTGRRAYRPSGEQNMLPSAIAPYACEAYRGISAVMLHRGIASGSLSIFADNQGTNAPVYQPLWNETDGLNLQLDTRNSDFAQIGSGSNVKAEPVRCSSQAGRGSPP